MNVISSELEISLIKGCIHEDRGSQRKLYESFYGYGMSVCLRYSRTEEEAIEILNDGFMKVFSKIRKYDSTKSFKGWLRKIMINTALDHFRKNEKFYDHKKIDTAKNEDVKFNIEEKLAYEEIIKIVQNLSSAYRVVFNMHVIDGYSHEEIAEMLGISVGTSKSNLSKARANLREMLTKIDKDEYAKYPK